MMTSKFLVIGYGNPLRGDDGVGWHIADRLAYLLPAAQAESIACQQLTPELAAPISQASTVLFIDASVSEPPGTFRLQPVLPARLAPTTFSHHLTPPLLLALAQQLYGVAPSAQLLSIGGLEFDAQEHFSATIAALMPHLLNVSQQLFAAQISPGATLA